MIQLPLLWDLPRLLLPQQGEALREIALPGGKVRYTLTRARRRTLSLLVTRNGVEVRAPRWVTLGAIESFIRDKENWIHRRLTDYGAQESAFGWQSGDRLPLFGREVRLEVLQVAASASGRRVMLEGDLLRAHIMPDDDPGRLRGSVIDYLRATSLDLFEKRVAHFSERLAVPLPEVKISNARTQWGSCSAKGRVRLNWRLVHVPERLIDYVVAHEIAHLRELNHSARFWALVESVYPQCRAARRELNLIEKRLPRL